MNCGSSVVGLLRSGGFPNIQWETRSGSIMWESLFATVPRSEGLSRAFFILVPVTLPSAELSRLSLQKIPQNRGGNSRLISVIGFGPRDWATPTNTCWVGNSYMIPIVYWDIDSALISTKPLDTKLPLGRCYIVITEINMLPDVVIVIVEKLARLVQLQLSRQRINKIAKKITRKFAKFIAGP